MIWLVELVNRGLVLGDPVSQDNVKGSKVFITRIIFRKGV